MTLSTYSQAFGFMDYVSNGVDTRTGQCSLSIQLRELISNFLIGPGFTPVLRFNPMNDRNLGFGKGWDWKLTRYDPRDRILSLAEGDTFKWTSSQPDGTPVFKENRLDTYHFTEQSDGTYRLAHRTGLIEILAPEGSGPAREFVPHFMYDPSGRMISLEYENFNGVPALQSVSDATGTLMRVDRNIDSTVVTIHIHPDNGPGGVPLASYTLNINSGRLEVVHLPTEEDACWTFKYEDIHAIRCVTEVNSPTGARDVFEYLGEGHLMPGGQGRLPRVSRHRTFPGQDQPPMIVDYEYQSNDTNIGHNFLGYGAAVSTEKGLDPLYNVGPDYNYGTVAKLIREVEVGDTVLSETIRSVRRTFNRFHSLIKEQTIQNQCVKTEEITYYAVDRPFESQPAQFQLPQEVKTSWSRLDDSSLYREEITSSKYNLNGNQTETTDADGTRTVTTYYLKEGEEGCPADPENFERHAKDVTVFPAPDGQPGAPTLRTRYCYEALEALTGSGMPGRLVVSEETLLQVEERNGKDVETELKTSVNLYVVEPDSVLLHGRIRSRSECLNGNTTTTQFEYCTPESALAGEPVLEIKETLYGFDHVEGSNEVKKTIPRQLSLLTGDVVLRWDENNVPTLTRYDALGRITSETIAPGDDDYEATLHYEYILAAGAGGCVRQEITDAKDVKRLTEFDGLNRPIRERCKFPDNNAGPVEGYFPIYTAEYDDQGNLFKETTTDYRGDIPMVFVRLLEYDDWGGVSRETGPDGVTMVNDASPFGKNGTLTRTWQESAETPPTISNLSVSETNRFGKADVVTWYDALPLTGRLRAAHAQGQPLDVTQQLNTAMAKGELPVVRSTEYSYNGLGSCIRQLEILDNKERTTEYEFDVWGRMRFTKLPDNTVVSRDYADHASGDLPTTLRVKPANEAKPVIEAGDLAYDGLYRPTQMTVGGRVEQYQYVGEQMQYSTLIKPSGKKIRYKYHLNLPALPYEVTAQSDMSSYEYDKTASITSARNSEGSHSYAYNTAGQLLTETRTDTAGTHEIRHVSSLQGRPLNRSQTLGPETLYTYDDCGRTKSVTQGTLRVDFEYNLQGHLCRTTTTNLHNNTTLVTETVLDSLDREIFRTLSVTGEPTRTISQTWYPDDQLKTRHLKIGEVSQLSEEFSYDAQGRLTIHTCTGTTLPKDVHGNPYNRQIFRYDAMNNIETCQTRFANDETDIANFTYSPDDPSQLITLTHSYTAGGYRATQSFEYDSDGNMLNDQNGLRMVYNSLGRLIEVKDPTGTQTLTRYRYDGHGGLIGVREGEQSETLRFYQGYSLSHTFQDDTHTHYLFHGAQPLGQQHFKDHDQAEHDRTMLLLTDASPSVIAECSQGGVRTAVYSAYGHRSANDDALHTLLAFNGEALEATTGTYLLGHGYRTYNTQLGRFHNFDSASPFGAGGYNGYMYVGGNPVNFRDPSGHRAVGGRRPGDDYIYPVEQAKITGLQKWLPLGGAIMGALFAIVFTPFTGGLSLGMVMGVAALGLAAASVGVTAYGIIEENDDVVAIGHYLGYASAAVGLASAAVVSIQTKLATRAVNAATKKALTSIDDALVGAGKTIGRALPQSGRGAAGTTSISGVTRIPATNTGDFLGIPRVRIRPPKSTAAPSSAQSPSPNSSPHLNPRSTSVSNSTSSTSSTSGTSQQPPVAASALPARPEHPDSIQYVKSRVPKFIQKYFGESYTVNPRRGE